MFRKYTRLITKRHWHQLCALSTPIKATVMSRASRVYRGNSGYPVTSGSVINPNRFIIQDDKLLA
jgi:hypothetical protein